MDLNGKKILVTGASSGIGQATAILISKLGGTVILNGRNEEKLNNTWLMLNGEGHFIVPYDLLNLDGLKQFVSECVKFDGQKFDGLVFSAGIGRGAPLRTESMESFKNVMISNCFTYVALLKAFSTQRMMNNFGSIVAVSSSAVVHYDKSQLSYACSKAVLETASAIAAKELVNRGIRVNTVRPEMTATPMTTFFQNSTTEEEKKELYPLGMLQAEDVANTIVFLLSDMSSKLTGQNIYISAGNDGRPIDFIM